MAGSPLIGPLGSPLFGAGDDIDVFLPQQPPGLDTDAGIGAEPLSGGCADLQGNQDLAGGLGRGKGDLRDGPHDHPGEPDRGADLEPLNVGEQNLHLGLRGEELGLPADDENDQAQQDQGRDKKDADFHFGPANIHATLHGSLLAPLRRPDRESASPPVPSRPPGFRGPRRKRSDRRRSASAGDRLERRRRDHG